MAKPLLTDDVWRSVEPLLPDTRPEPGPGRPRVSNRACLTGILFVLKTGIPWEQLPCEVGCGSGMTCWRRLREWQRQGAWRNVQRVLGEHLEDADRIDWQRANRPCAAPTSRHAAASARASSAAPALAR